VAWCTGKCQCCAELDLQYNREKVMSQKKRAEQKISQLSTLCEIQDDVREYVERLEEIRESRGKLG
jgi:hypothetical protein